MLVSQGMKYIVAMLAWRELQRDADDAGNPEELSAVQLHPHRGIALWHFDALFSLSLRNQ